MIYIRKEVPKGLVSYYYKVFYTDNILKVVKLNFNGKNVEEVYSNTFDMAQLIKEKDTWDFSVYESNSADGCGVIPSIISSTALQSSLRKNRLAEKTNPIAHLMFYEKDPTKAVIIVNDFSKIESDNQEQVLIGMNKLARDYLLSEYPEATKMLATRDAKTEILAEVDILDSLSYMEVQLDFITEVLFVIAENAKLEEEIKEEIKDYAELKESITDSLLSSVKDISSRLEELKTKAKLRSLQKSYYETKAVGEDTK